MWVWRGEFVEIDVLDQLLMHKGMPFGLKVKKLISSALGTLSKCYYWNLWHSSVDRPHQLVSQSTTTHD